MANQGGTNGKSPYTSLFSKVKEGKDKFMGYAQKLAQASKRAEQNQNNPATNGIAGNGVTPTSISNPAQNYAQNKYNNVNLGLTQQEQLLRQQQGQLMTDKYIQDRAQRQANLKYAEAIQQAEQNKRSAMNQYQTNKQNLNTQYSRGVDEVKSNAMAGRARAKSEANNRGLYNFSILDQNRALISAEETKAVGDMTESFQNNIANLDRDIATTVQNLNERKGLLTQQQQSEAVGMIQDMMRERDNERGKLNLLLQQIGAQRSQALSNMEMDRWNMQSQLDDRSFQRQQYADSLRQRDLDNQYRDQEFNFRREQAGLNQPERSSDYYNIMLNQMFNQNYRNADGQSIFSSNPDTMRSNIQNELEGAVLSGGLTMDEYNKLLPLVDSRVSSQRQQAEEQRRLLRDRTRRFLPF